MARVQLVTNTGLHEVRRRDYIASGLGGVAPYYPRPTAVALVGDGGIASYAKLYRENPWLNAGVRTIAWGVSRAHLHTYVRQADGQRKQVRADFDSPGPRGAAARIDQMLQMPTGPKGPQRRMRRTMVDLLVWSNALWEYVPTYDGYDLRHIAWRRVEPLVVNDEILGFKVRSDNGDERYLGIDQVIHFCTDDDPDSPLGAPPIQALKYTLQLHDAIQRHLTNFFGNAARPSANLKVPPTAKREDIEYMQTVISDLYAAPENAGKVFVTSGDFQPVTAGADQTQLIELAKLSREEIAGALRIPGPVLGFLENAIKSNVKELREQYIRDVVGAWAPQLEDDFMQQLVRRTPGSKGVFVGFDLDAQLMPDMEGLAKVAKDLESTVATNERRRWFGLPDLPYDEADSVATPPGGGYLGFQVANATEGASGAASGGVQR